MSDIKLFRIGTGMVDKLTGPFLQSSCCASGKDSNIIWKCD